MNGKCLKTVMKSRTLLRHLQTRVQQVLESLTWLGVGDRLPCARAQGTDMALRRFLWANTSWHKNVTCSGRVRWTAMESPLPPKGSWATALSREGPKLALLQTPSLSRSKPLPRAWQPRAGTTSHPDPASTLCSFSRGCSFHSPSKCHVQPWKASGGGRVWKYLQGFSLTFHFLVLVEIWNNSLKMYSDKGA